MKKICLLAALLCMVGTMTAQSKAVQQFYDRYRGLEDVENIKLRGWMLRMASNLSDSANEAQLLRKISRLQILTTEHTSLIKPQDRKRFLSNLRKEAFEELITIRNEGKLVEMLIREDGETITDLVLMVSDSEEFVLINMEGALRFSDLNDLNFNVSGAEHLQNLPDNKSDIPKA